MEFRGKLNHSATSRSGTKIMTIYFSFLRENYIHKIKFRNSFYKFLIKIHLESLYLVIILSFIGNRIQQYFLQLYNLNITSMSRTTLFENSPGLPAILSCNMTYISFFSVSTTFEVTSCIFKLTCFNCSNSLVLLQFLFHHYDWCNKFK